MSSSELTRFSGREVFERSDSDYRSTLTVLAVISIIAAIALPFLRLQEPLILLWLDTL